MQPAGARWRCGIAWRMVRFQTNYPAGKKTRRVFLLKGAATARNAKALWRCPSSGVDLGVWHTGRCSAQQLGPSAEGLTTKFLIIWNVACVRDLTLFGPFGPHRRFRVDRAQFRSPDGISHLAALKKNRHARIEYQPLKNSKRALEAEGGPKQLQRSTLTNPCTLILNLP